MAQYGSLDSVSNALLPIAQKTGTSMQSAINDLINDPSNVGLLAMVQNETAKHTTVITAWTQLMKTITDTGKGIARNY